MMRNFKNVPHVLFGRDCCRQLGTIVDSRRAASPIPIAVYLVDDVFQRNAALPLDLPQGTNDLIQWISVAKEPGTDYVDQLTSEIRRRCGGLPSILIGIGGGSTLDITKAVSIMLTNEGRSQDYQGWDIPDKAPIFKIGIPTLSGTGAEVSRTCVLTGPKQKLGINSDFSVFDQIILDCNMIAGAPKVQRFFTGMDCYIHAVESLRGSLKNAFGQAFAEKALELSRRVFLEDGCEDDLMTASYLGGCSVLYSETGVCHALSYGLSLVFGYRHGEGNCIIFNQLDEFYPKDVAVYREMLTRNQITLPGGIMRNVTEEQMQRMVEMTLRMEKPLTNALGPNWRSVMTVEKIRELYRRL
jgi:3-deoxy-alpha-D-manno-octulosonate 8-oxidase